MIEEEVEQDRELPKHRVAWTAVKRYSKFTQPRASSIRAGLKKADGSPTTSVKESQDLLADYYRGVFSPHPIENPPSPGSSASDESGRS